MSQSVPRRAHGYPGGRGASLGGTGTVLPPAMPPGLVWGALLLAIAVALYLRLRRGSKQDLDRAEHAREQQMNLEIRRSQHVERLQMEYERRALEAKQLQEAKEKQAAEERARMAVAAAMKPTPPPLLPPAGDTGRGEFNPLMGSGPVGGFRSQRCVKRGG